MTDLPPAPIGHNLELDPHSFGKHRAELDEMSAWVKDKLKGDVRYSFSREIRDARTHETKKVIGLTFHFAQEDDFYAFKERYD